MASPEPPPPFSDQACQWLMLGSGQLELHDFPIFPEPYGIEFTGYKLPPATNRDEGRRTSLLGKILGLGSESRPQPNAEDDAEEEASHEVPLNRSGLAEISMRLPVGYRPHPEHFTRLLDELELVGEPMSFECIGNGETTEIQFAVGAADADRVLASLSSHYPEALFSPTEFRLATLTGVEDGCYGTVFECGLEEEFVYPLSLPGSIDPLCGLVGALGGIPPGSSAVYQVLFQKTLEPWGESLTRLLKREDGTPVFPETKDLVAAADRKRAQKLYAVTVRIAAFADAPEKLAPALGHLAGSLRGRCNPAGNSITPLANSDYPLEDQITDLLNRQGRRFGMILGQDELSGFVHIPSAEVESPQFARGVTNSRSAPERNLASNGRGGLILGSNEHRGHEADVVLSTEDRVRHTHIVGIQGSGKTTLLYNMIRQDIEMGNGVAVLDPHGDLVSSLLRVIPEERINDVVWFDPGDEEAAVGFNVLIAHSDTEKTILSSDLVSIFRRLSTSWGDRMDVVFRNAVLAFLDSSQGGTLRDLQRFLSNQTFRNQFLSTVADPDIVEYWQERFKPSRSDSTVDAILTRLETFLAPKQIRHIVSQKANTLDFADIMDSGKIFLARMSHGSLGRENSELLGSLLVTKFQQTAMARLKIDEAERRHFWLYIDEFQNYASQSMTEMLTESRKSCLGLTLAHQHLGQLQREQELPGAVMGCQTRIVFQATNRDSRTLAEGFHHFEASDIQALEIGKALCSIGSGGNDFNLAVSFAPVENTPEVKAHAARVVAASQKRFATPIADLSRERRPEPPATPTEAPEAKPPRTPAHDGKTRPATPQTAAESSSPKEPRAAQPTAKEPAEPTVDTPNPSPSPSLGRGGTEHKRLQALIKETGTEAGFHAVTEKQTPDGQGSIDVALESATRRIAVEICVTTSVSHEMGNARKCLAAGYTETYLLSPEAHRVASLRQALSAEKPTVAEAVNVMTVDEFLEMLELERKSGAGAAPEGSTIKRKYRKLSQEEEASVNAAALDAIARALRGED